MAFNIAVLDNAVKEAVNIADLVEKFADAVPAADIPGIGPEVQAAQKAIELVDKALHALQAALASAA